jgi:hypothetical protein
LLAPAHSNAEPHGVLAIDATGIGVSEIDPAAFPFVQAKDSRSHPLMSVEPNLCF